MVTVPTVDRRFCTITATAPCSATLGRACLVVNTAFPLMSTPAKDSSVPSPTSTMSTVILCIIWMVKSAVYCWDYLSIVISAKLDRLKQISSIVICFSQKSVQMSLSMLMYITAL